MRQTAARPRRRPGCSGRPRRRRGGAPGRAGAWRSRALSPGRPTREVGAQARERLARHGDGPAAAALALDQQERVVGVVEVARREVQPRRLARPQAAAVEHLHQRRGPGAERPGPAAASHIRRTAAGDRATTSRPIGPPGPPRPRPPAGGARAPGSPGRARGHQRQKARAAATRRRRVARRPGRRVAPSLPPVERDRGELARPRPAAAGSSSTPKPGPAGAGRARPEGRREGRQVARVRGARVGVLAGGEERARQPAEARRGPPGRSSARVAAAQGGLHRLGGHRRCSAGWWRGWRARAPPAPPAGARPRRRPAPPAGGCPRRGAAGAGRPRGPTRAGPARDHAVDRGAVQRPAGARHEHRRPRRRPGRLARTPAAGRPSASQARRAATAGSVSGTVRARPPLPTTRSESCSKSRPGEHQVARLLAAQAAAVEHLDQRPVAQGQGPPHRRRRAAPAPTPPRARRRRPGRGAAPAGGAGRGRSISSAGERPGGWCGASHSRSAVTARARVAGAHSSPRNAASRADGRDRLAGRARPGRPASRPPDGRRPGRPPGPRADSRRPRPPCAARRRSRSRRLSSQVDTVSPSSATPAARTSPTPAQ